MDLQCIPMESKSSNIDNRNNPRCCAAAVLKRILQQGAHVAPALNHALQQSRLTAQDKALCTQLVYGTLRWLTPLHTCLKQTQRKQHKNIQRDILPHLLLGAYQLQHLNNSIPPHAAVYETVQAIKSIQPQQTGFANALLRNLRAAPHTSLPNPCNSLHHLQEAFGLPMQLLTALQHHLSQMPDAAQHIGPAATAFNEQPDTWLCTLVDQQHTAAWRHELQQREIRTQAHPFIPSAYRIQQVGDLTQLPGFHHGAWQVQDPASQAVAHLVNAQTGQIVFDLCAAPGSKSMLLAQQVAPKGTLLALDIHPHRCRLIKQNATRVGCHLQIRCMDARTLATATPPQTPQQADAVLVDAPCSGLGTIRRRPDIKQRWQQQKLPELMQLQHQLLEAAAHCVKPNGALVYSVCSPLPQEGTDQIQQFLQRHPEFKRSCVQTTLPWLPNSACTPQGDMLLLPHLHQADAFFACRLHRRD